MSETFRYSRSRQSLSAASRRILRIVEAETWTTSRKSSWTASRRLSGRMMFKFMRSMQKRSMTIETKTKVTAKSPSRKWSDPPGTGSSIPRSFTRMSAFNQTWRSLGSQSFEVWRKKEKETKKSITNSWK